MNYIFTDCFDTLIMRREHPFQVIRRWAQCVCRLYPFISSDELYLTRLRLMRDAKSELVGIEIVFKKLYDIYASLITDKNAFLSDLHMLEIKCEESTLVVRKKTISFLKKKKSEGCKLICITDYHLQSEDIFKILVDKSITIIDMVFSSASLGQTKKSGELYQTVLNQLGINPQDCMMIGDNKVSDIKNAESNGIKTKYYPNTFHKNWLKIKNRLGIDNYSLKAIGEAIWRNNDTYNEYALVFYTFCNRLYKEATDRKINQIVFLAREGYFLKKCFEAYQRICIPEDKRLKTEYLKCSRRAIHSVQREKCLPSFFDKISVTNYFLSIGYSEDEGRSIAKSIGIDNPDVVITDFSNSNIAKTIWNAFGSEIEKRIEENRDAFKTLVRSILDDNNLLLVDVGWIGRMQQGIDSLFDDIKTVGFYLGIYQSLFEPPFVERHGLIFNKTEQGQESYLFHVFRANTQFYEQLLAAPHGSACYYGFDSNGKPFVHEKWDTEEELVYKEVIEDVQNELFKIFEEVCTFFFDGNSSKCDSISKYNKELALIMLRSCLVQTKKRLKFMKRLIEGFSYNFQQQSTGMNFSVKKVDEKYSNVITHPDRFVRYFAKLGVVFDRKKLGFLGRLIMHLYYAYARIILHI